MIGIVDLGKWCGAAQYGRSCSNNSNFCCGGLFFSIFCSCSKSFWDLPHLEGPPGHINPKTIWNNARQHAKAHPATPASTRKRTRQRQPARESVPAGRETALAHEKRAPPWPETRRARAAGQVGGGGRQRASAGECEQAATRAVAAAETGHTLANPCHPRQRKRGDRVSGGAEAQRGDSPGCACEAAGRHPKPQGADPSARRRSCGRGRGRGAGSRWRSNRGDYRR